MCIIDEILSKINEAKCRDYPEFVLRYDLDNILRNYLNYYVKDEQQAYDDGYDAGYSEAKDEEYQEAYDDGYNEAENEIKSEFIQLLARKVIQLKSKIKNCEFALQDELQLALTTLIIDMDENNNLDSDLDDELAKFDNEGTII